MAKLQFDLVSPERRLLAEEVDMVTVPGAEGEFGVLAGHAPLVSTLKAGFVSVKNGNQPEQKIFVRGGFAEVGPSGLTILAEEAMPANELDAGTLDAQIRDAEDEVKNAGTLEHRERALEALERLREVRAAIA